MSTQVARPARHIQAFLSFRRTITFTFVDLATFGRPNYPILLRTRINRPLRVRRLIIQGHQTSVFRACDHGEDPELDAMHASLVRSFNPEEFHLVGLDPDWHSRTDICAALERNPDRPGWTRLKRVCFQGASLYPPLRSISFGGIARSGRTPWEFIFEVQSASHPTIVVSKTHRVEWLNNLGWHLFQRDGPGWGEYPTFPSSMIRRVIVMVKSREDQMAAETLLRSLAEQQLGLEAAVQRMQLIDILVGRVDLS